MSTATKDSIDTHAGAWISALKPLRDDYRPLSLPNSPVIEAAENAMDMGAHLAGDRKHVARNLRRSAKDLRRHTAALKHLSGLPAEGESWHCIVSGQYSLADLIPAVARLIEPATISDLHIATLSFSKGNISTILQLFDAKKIAALTLLCSHYFSATSREIYDDAAIGFASRGQRFSSCRTHAKVMAFAISDGRRFTVESSANLRSCKNVEQFVLTNDPALYDFHKAWIKELSNG